MSLREEQNAASWLAIAPSPARLLHVAFKAAGHSEVHHTAHIRLVDAHAKSDRGCHHLNLVLAEVILSRPALCWRLATMKGQGSDTPSLQLRCHLVGVIFPDAVDDGGRIRTHRRIRAPIPPSDRRVIAQVLCIEKLPDTPHHGCLVLKLLHGIVQVRPIHRAQDLLGALQAQGPHHVLTNLRLAGGGQRHDWRGLTTTTGASQGVDDEAQLVVLFPEVMAPFRDTVSLVDRQQRDALQHLQRLRLRLAHRPLRGHEDHRRAAAQLLQRAGPAALAPLRRADHRPHATATEPLRLVMHQRDQG
mmetsp:Transcript_97516/g.232159  ORF Transcript_97516/g.232159 Transcript_97516/m.232159 type:complete len:303 (+) Transcript_97516:1527-2435(+)